MTNVPMPTFGPTGFTSPEELAILSGVLADFNGAFGGNLNLGLSTPQGQLSTSFAAVIGAFNDLFVDFTNQVDPAFAGGRMQDAIARIYFLTRRGATATVVTGRCSGATGVLIPAGSLARATDGTIYSSLEVATIPLGGFVDIQFAALVPGAIACPINSLTTIYRTVPGWDSITNPTAGTPGRDEESQEQLEERRGLSVASNALGIIPAVRGSVLGVTGVVDAYVTDNPLATSATIGGVSVAANSLYVAVLGGSDADVAKAIWRKKPPGCNYTGGTTVTVTDTESGYLTPPSYTVKFQRASAVAINFVVTIATGPNVPADAAQQIQDAITAAFPTIARIGQKVFASSFVCAIGALGSWVHLLTITVNAGTNQAININQYPALGTFSVTVV